MTAPLPKHRNKWESALHMDEYYVVGVTLIPYPGYGCFITIVSKKKNIPCLHCRYSTMHLPKLCKNVVFGSGKEGTVGFM
jgi:hypothetical protein